MLHPTENQSLVLLGPLLERVQWSCLRFRSQRNQSPVDILPRSVHRGVLEETVRTFSSRSGRLHWPPDPALRSGCSRQVTNDKLPMTDDRMRGSGGTRRYDRQPQTICHLSFCYLSSATSFIRVAWSTIGIGFSSDKIFWNRGSLRNGSHSGSLAKSP